MSGGTLGRVYIFFCFVDDDELHHPHHHHHRFSSAGSGLNPTTRGKTDVSRENSRSFTCAVHGNEGRSGESGDRMSTLGFAQSSFAAQPEEVVGNLAVSMAESPSSSCLRVLGGRVQHLGPGLNQLEDMQKKNSKRRGVGGAIGRLGSIPDDAGGRPEQVVW